MLGANYPFPVQQYLNEETIQKVYTDVAKAGIKAEIEVQKSAQIAMQRQHIKTAYEVCGRDVQIAADGEIYLVQQMPSGNVQMPLGYKVMRPVKYFEYAGNLEPFVLNFSLKRTEREEVFYLASTPLTKQNIKRLFVRSGIHFGCKQRLEDEIQILLIKKIINISAYEALPSRHGWYEEDGEWKFAFPENLVWREVWRHANASISGTT